MALTSSPIRRASRGWLAAVIASGGGVVALAACSSFGTASTPTPDDGGPPAEAGSRADGASLCDGGVRVIETFDGLTDVTMFHGWTGNPGNAVGALDLATTDDIKSGLAPPYLRVRSTLDGTSKTKATIQRVIALRPSHVTLAFDVGLGAADLYAEYGCAVFLRKADNSGTYFNMHTGSALRRLVQAQAEVEPGAAVLGELSVGSIPDQTSRHIIFQIDVDPANDAVFSTTIVGRDGASTKATPKFALATEVVETAVECGVIYGAHAGVGSGKLEVAVDNVDLTVCP